VQPVNALTVDVEDYFQVAALSAAIDRADWAATPSRVVGNTRRVLDIFDGAGARATFFVLGWVADRFPDLVKEIHRRGHEIASHGQSHRLVYEQSPAEFRDETQRSKATLEALVGERVMGYRAASYSIVERSLWALDVIAEVGFEYDSSIVPARHDLYGIPGAEAFPHRLRTPRGATLVEFPPTTYQVLGARVPVGGGGYFRFYPYWLSRRLLRRINGSMHRPFIFYVHPWEVDPEQPRVRAGWRSRFRHYVNLQKTEARLNRLVRDFRFGTVRQVLRDLELLA
jgi:polysaccharide deacetylase family protein (PEP-CTERM system associated)